MESTASLTLRKALLFLAQARNADINEREVVATNLEAAIVFCRSVTFHLQSQFAHSPGFHDWYAEQQRLLGHSPISRFMLNQRNYVLKVGPTVVTRVINVSITESLTVHDDLTVQVTRGQPWYKRTLKILLDDLIYPLRQKVRIWLERRRRRMQAQIAAQPSEILTRDSLYFSEAPWNEIDAFDLVGQHLSALAEIVKQAEAHFLSTR